MEKIIEMLEIASLIFMPVIVLSLWVASVMFLVTTYPVSTAFATLLAISLGLGWWFVNE